MQISLNWMNEYVDLTDKTVEEIAHALTISGLEVEEIEKVEPKFTNITTAFIKSIENHPDADKLHLVTLKTAFGEKTVVCGAQNIKEGQIIPYATVGSKVFSRKTNELFELTPAKIRGVESQGMLCSQDELGLEGLQEEDGILILNKLFESIEIGANLEKVLNIENDTILHLAPTANRGDQMSMIGVARELSALFDKKINFSYLENSQNLSNTDFKVEIIDKDVCKYYSVGILKDIKIKPAPLWMQKHLVAGGMRPINNVVDITNYVLLEYGQPLHAFDYDKLGNYLCVRRAKQGETIVTIDGVERNLNNDSVLIATKNEGVCIAGVFGGENSEIDDNSKNIALESAYFTPAANRKSSRSVGYRSEACARFEHGVDIEAVKPALFRAIDLLIKYADAKLEGIVETGENVAENIEITLRYSQVKKVLGVQIPSEKCCEILENLGFTLLGKNEAAAKFKVPSCRVNDVYREVDLIEEIARINGYDKIMPTLPNNRQAADISPENKTISTIHNILLAQGFYEAMSSSLIGEPLLRQFDFEFDKEKTVSVLNPQSEDFKTLRQSLIPNMLQMVKYNFDNGQKDFWLYELGKIYFKTAAATKENSGVDEIRQISGAMTGNIANSKWQAPLEVDFYLMKGILENIFAELNLTNRIRFEKIDNCNYLHPNISAKIVLLGKTPTTIATFGKLHPSIKQKQKMLQDVYLFELNLDEILSVVNYSDVRYKKISQYPEVQRDIAFVVPEHVTNNEIVKTIKKAVASDLFNGTEVFDVYQGEKIESGYKSVAYRLKLQDKNATLTDVLVDEQVTKVKSTLLQTIKDVTFRE